MWFQTKTQDTDISILGKNIREKLKKKGGASEKNI